MARRVSRRTHQQELMQTWWVRALLAVAFLLMAYGFASLAIDSGNLLEYAAAIVLIWYGAKQVIRSVRLAFFA
jgi:type VI protein secretion system component VasF